MSARCLFSALLGALLCTGSIPSVSAEPADAISAKLRIESFDKAQGLVAAKKDDKKKKNTTKSQGNSDHTDARAGVTEAGGALVRTIGAESYWSACMIDAQSGQVLLQEHADDKTYPGDSISLMVLLLAAERLQSGALSPNAEITLSDTAASVTGATDIPLPAGTKTTVREAMSCIAVRPCVNMTAALAETLFGSQEQALSAMNSRAKLLGMRNTSYCDFTGLDGRMFLHEKKTFASTSVRDMTLLGKELLRNKMTAALLKMKSYRTSFPQPGGKPKTLNTSNRLLRKNTPSVIGLWESAARSPHAGMCGLFAFDRNGRQYILAIWGAHTYENLELWAMNIINDKAPLPGAATP